MHTKLIHKSLLRLIPIQCITLPVDAKILDVQVQRGIPCIWFEFEETPFSNTTAYCDREFVIIGTGIKVDVEDDVKLEYIGTFQLEDGDLVLHVYEKRGGLGKPNN
jgi:hypothetical protein